MTTPAYALHSHAASLGVPPCLQVGVGGGFTYTGLTP